MRDTIYGYITIPKPIVKELIDLPEYQRLKDIQQTGMRVLYPSATHDRFTHSLGVYHLGKRSFLAFTNNLRHLKTLKGSENYYDLVGEEKWTRWSLLFQLACLLHDCGHAPFSHTLEFIYNLSVDTDQQPPRTFFSVKTLIDYFSKTEEHKDFVEFLRSLIKDEKDPANPVKKPAPHELMSACYVTQSPFVDAITSLVEDHMAQWQEAHELEGKPSEPIENDLEFICRMILVVPYALLEPDDASYYERQLRNCVIRLLNSELDADNLDYTLRDARFSGYESQEIDLERLQNALTVIPALEFDDQQVSLQLNNPVVCKSFQGPVASGEVSEQGTYLYGACTLHAEEGVTAEGNLQLLEGVDSSPQITRKYLFTREEFSAQIISPNVTISGPDGKDAKLFVRGKLEGKFTGTVYGKVNGSEETIQGAKELILFAFNKSCLSVLESAVSARNYEYLWIYAHHTIAYETAFLQIYLIDRYASYLFHNEENDNLTHLMDKIENVSVKEGPEKTCGEVAGHLFSDEFIDSITFPKIQEAMDRIISFRRAEPYVEASPEDRPIRSHECRLVECAIDPAEKRPIDSEEKRSIDCPIQSHVCRLVKCAIELAEKRPIQITECGLEAAKFLLEIGVQVFKMYIRTQPFHAEDTMEKWEELLEKKLKELFGVLPQEGEETADWKQQKDEINRLFYRVKHEETTIMVDLMSMGGPLQEASTWFYRSTDHDLLCRYKSLYYKLNTERQVSNLKPENEEFWRVLREYISRHYLSCAWKTYAEYKHHFRHWNADEIKRLKDALQERGSRLPGDERSRIWVMDENIRVNLVKDPGLTESEENIWKIFCEAGITRVVWIEHKIKTKNLEPDETFIRFKDSALRLRDVDLGSSKPASREFAFLFYEMKEPDEELNSDQLEKMLLKLHVCVKNLPDKRRALKSEMDESGMPSEKEKSDMNEQKKTVVIRDVVHGDITIPPRFMRLVDTREFQRLRRIRQLATAYMVFPGADHTRFAHSVGCFSVMQKLEEHFKKQFEETGIQIQEEEWDAVLAASLLHDLGHGPFSHAFEKATRDQFKHEDWTLRLIREDTQVHEVLQSFYGQDDPRNKEFVERVCRYIEKRNDQKVPSEGGEAPALLERPTEIHDLMFVFGSLVGSQLDADRMDYILRDAYHTGFRFGNVDINKIIEGLQLTVGSDGRFELCILESHVPFVEDYLLARFQMYKNVYMEDYKIFTEKLFQRLLERAMFLCVEAEGKPLREFTPVAIRNIFDGSKMSCELYTKLDDGLIMGAIQNWNEFQKDDVLVGLCRSFLDRNGFSKLSLMGNTQSDFEEYREQLKQILHESPSVLTAENCWCLVEAEGAYELYDPEKESIQVLTNEGEICELSKVSELFRGITRKKVKKHAYYLNEAVLASQTGSVGWKEDLNRLNKKFQNRSHIEIEQKYLVSDPQIFEVLKAAFGFGEAKKPMDIFQEYQFEFGGESAQEDVYYDMENDGVLRLAEAKQCVRIRKKGEHYKLTVKLPTQLTDEAASDQPSGGQSNRFEYEKELESDAFDEECQNYIRRQFERRGQDTAGLVNLEPWLKVKNSRQIINVSGTKTGLQCEMVFDTVIFSDPRGGGEGSPWYQIEIELKSDYLYRPNLSIFCNLLQKVAEDRGTVLQKTGRSKYICGLEQLGLYHTV